MSLPPLPPVDPLTITVTPSSAANAYKTMDGMLQGAQTDGDIGSFSTTLQRAIQGEVDSGRRADAMSMNAIAGNADLTQVITAVSKAELALQTATVIRDHVVQAYQEVMRMTI